MRKFSIPAVIVLVCSVFVLAACKKNGDTALVVLNIFPRVGTDSLIIGNTYVNPSGRNITVNRAEYYISNINMVNTNGSLQPITGVLLVTPQTTQYILGSVPTGSYKSIQFSVGVDSADNHLDPGSQVAGSYLANQSPSMHFANNSIGYIFLALEGSVDTSVAGTGTPTTAYSYHIGTDPLLEAVSLPDHSASPYNAVFTASGDKLVSINLLADFNALLRNVDMRSNTITNTTDYPVLADTIAAHVPLMFSYQQ